MKINIYLKDPDGVWESIRNAVTTSVDELGLPDEEADALVEKRTDLVNQKLSKWIEYGEYVSVDFDLDAMTATVRHVK